MVSNNVLPVQDDTNYSDLIGKLTSRSNYNMVRKFYISTYINVFLGGSCVSSIGLWFRFRRRELYCLNETTIHGPRSIGLSGNQWLRITLPSYKNAIILPLHLEVLRQASSMLAATLSFFWAQCFGAVVKYSFVAFIDLYDDVNDSVLFIFNLLNDTFKAPLAFSKPKSDLIKWLFNLSF